MDSEILLPVPEFRSVTPSEFVRFWSSLYSYPQEHLYDDNIDGRLNWSRLESLFIWKNGTPLSDKKLASVERNFKPFVEEGIELARTVSPKQFLSRFRSGGAIWRIFFLHCCHPPAFPIFDQHVWRSHQVLRGIDNLELRENDDEKIRLYLTEYLPFWAKFKNVESAATIDRALWAFGKTCKPIRSGVNWHTAISAFYEQNRSD